jgi:hypothetical protein
MRTQTYNWSNKSSFVPYKKYQIASPNRIVIIGARKARKARLMKAVKAATTTTTTTSTIPAENIAAIELLDSWLSRPETDSGDHAEDIRRRIDENRLSDRKFFT